MGMNFRWRGQALVQNSGIATGEGVKRGRVPPDIEKNCQKSGKIWEKKGKIRKKRKNQEEKAMIFHFAPWQIGLARPLVQNGEKCLMGGGGGECECS